MRPMPPSRDPTPRLRSSPRPRLRSRPCPPVRPRPHRAAAPARIALAALLLATVSTAGAQRTDYGATDRIVVRMHATGELAKRGAVEPAHAELLSRAAGVALRPVRATFAGAYVLALPAAVRGADAAALASRLAALPGVAYAEPDARRRIAALSDTYIASQSYLHDTAQNTGTYAAWEVTRGSPDVVVAVIDTGILPHADLAGRVLPGFDAIRDTAIANDGDGRDLDASDPGDWVDESDRAGALAGLDCPLGPSSWHGTGVAGILAANPDNRIGVAGMDWQSRVLPVRALGKCGGYVSDIADAIAWSAGVPLPGAPANPTPAQVINLSLGSREPCSISEQLAIDAAFARGVTRAVVAAAGNDSGDAALSAPANCRGVISVTSTTSNGRLASYSNFGPTVTLAAPGGDFNFAAGAYKIIVLSNRGRTSPGADSYFGSGGTSLAAPMVAAAAGLMLAANPSLAASQVRDILRRTAKPFLDESCDTQRCGAGYLDTDGAVRLAAATPGGQGTAPGNPGGASALAVEFYHAALDHYFLTASADEIAKLDAGVFQGWARTGESFPVYVAGGGAEVDAKPVCRFYGRPEAGLDSHFYTPFATECADVQAQFAGSWQLESTDVFRVHVPDALGACPAGTTPVHRFFDNRIDANHRYVARAELRQQMVARGWVPEGVGPDAVIMCAGAGG